MPKNQIPPLLIALAAALLLAGCNLFTPDYAPYPDPAWKHCIEQGGEIEEREANTGEPYQVCAFPDGNECGKWAYYNGRCIPGEEQVLSTPQEDRAEQYCKGLGYTVRSTVISLYGTSRSNCEIDEATTCWVWDFLSGRCHPEYTYCELNGGTIEAVIAPGGTATCILPDGTECNEFDYLLGLCPAEEEESGEEG